LHRSRPFLLNYRLNRLFFRRSPNRDFFADDDLWKKACVKQRQDLQDFLSKGKKLLIKRGVAQERVETDYIESCHSPLSGNPDYCSRGTSIAQDILHVVKEEGLGTVAIGRRGVSKAEEFMFGSVSNKIIHSGRDCTIWVVQ
jgi:hypothetical protein